MKKEIPNIVFNPSKKAHLDFELMSISNLKKATKDYKHSPEKIHQLNFYMLVFFTEGEGEHFIDFKWYPVKKGDLLFITQDQVHSFKFKDDLKGFCLFFNEDFLIKSLSHLPEKFAFRQFSSQLTIPIVYLPENSDFKTYFDLLIMEYNKAGSFKQKTILESIFVILLAKTEHHKQYETFFNVESSKAVLFQKFVTLISKHYTESRSAEFYALQLSITYKHLNTVCKSLINKTAKNIIDDHVILYAKRLLINSTIKSTELAYKMGFEQPTNFTKYFKKHTGFTPKDFKNKF